MKDFLNAARQIGDEIVANRRTIHTYAEVGFDLPQTHAFVMEKLKEYGYEPKPLGRMGIVCTIGRPGKTIMLRADMDALPMGEESGESFAAVNGNCHSCGHDCHTAMLLGAAKLLREREEELPGTVKFMFQPAEELLSGAKDMIDSGVLENPKVDVALALHVMMGFEDSETGSVRCTRGSVTNSGDAVRVTVRGKDAHGSRPELGVDAIHIAAQIVLALEALEACEIPTAEDSIVLVGRIEGGTSCNSVAGEAVLEISIRTTGPKERAFLLRRVEEISKGVAATFRGEAVVEHMYGSPALINNDDMLDACISYLGELLPQEAIVKSGKLGGGEDFTMVAEQVPSVFLTLGAGSPREGYEVFVHNPATRINETALPVGTAVYAHCALRWLQEHC